MDSDIVNPSITETSQGLDEREAECCMILRRDQSWYDDSQELDEKGVSLLSFSRVGIEVL